MLDAAFAPSPAYKTPSFPPNLLTNPPPPLPYLSRLSQALLNSQLLQFGPRPNSESSSLSLSLALRSATPSVARVRRVCWRRTRLCRFRASWGGLGTSPPTSLAAVASANAIRSGTACSSTSSEQPSQQLLVESLHARCCDTICFASAAMGVPARPPGYAPIDVVATRDRPWNDHPRTCSESRAFLREARMQLCRLLRTFMSRCGCNHMQGLGCVPRLDAARVCAKQHPGSSV